MGLFFGGFDDRSIPGLRKGGFARYREVLEENWKDFIKVGFITLVFFIPLGAGLVYAVGTKSALLAILAGLAGGAISGLGYACMVDLILRRLRNDRDDWSVCWKRSMKQNALASLLPGICLLTLFGRYFCLCRGFLGRLILLMTINHDDHADSDRCHDDDTQSDDRRQSTLFLRCGSWIIPWHLLTHFLFCA